MINPKVLKIAMSIGSILSSLRPMLFSVIGGLVVAGVQQCHKPEPVNIVLKNDAHEQQLSKIEGKIDSINNNIPDFNESVRYLSKRYPDRKNP